MEKQNDFFYKDDCEVCGKTSLPLVLDLGNHPLCDDLVPIGNNLVCHEYPIQILYCQNCKTAHQRVQVKKETLFPQSYHYRSRFTSDVLVGMSDLVESCVDLVGSLDNKVVLDVGCNDGSLLNFFNAKNAITIGVDPTDAIHDANEEKHYLIQDYFGTLAVDKVKEKFNKVDIICFTNVFAHIEDLPSLLSNLKRLISDETIIVIENHYLGAVLDKTQFDTFYHEHPRTYSATSFVYIAKTLGLELVDVEFKKRYGGNIRVVLGHKGPAQLAKKVLDVLDNEKKFDTDITLIQKRIEFWKLEMRSKIAKLVGVHGPLYAKAFPGRAAILVKLLGLDSKSIKATYEKPGSKKIGHYIPGTRIEIRSEQDYFALTKKNAPLVNLAWHISTEIHEYMRSKGYVGEIIDIFDPKQVVD